MDLKRLQMYLTDLGETQISMFSNFCHVVKFIAINEIGWFDNIANVQKNSIGGDVVASCIYFLDCFLYLL